MPAERRHLCPAKRIYRDASRSSIGADARLLALLGAGPSYGYDLKHGHDRHFGPEKPLAFGQVYATHARLLRDGLIEMLGEQAGSGPDRKRHEITEVRRARVTASMFTPDAPEPLLRNNLIAKTAIALLFGG